MNTGAIRARDLAVLQNQRTRRPAGPLGLDLRYAVLPSCQRFETRGSDCLPLEGMRASTGGRCCSQPLNARRFHQKTGLKQQSDGGIGAKWWPCGPTPCQAISQLRESPRVASCGGVIRCACRMPRRAAATRMTTGTRPASTIAESWHYPSVRKPPSLDAAALETSGQSGR